ncbi:MAG TPA: DNA ligase D [Devosiaceae bacterium]|nr:DNA ligase D [Devosiaceae bacterium]
MSRAPATLLKTYRQKRDFSKTAEPSGETTRARPSEALRFVVQKHDARRLHYDFRLELDGVLKSWAVTRGPSTDPADRRLAVRVEDHPLDYGGFEGTIPAGEYGGGTVMLWDEGTWEPIGDPHQGLEKGEIRFRLNGRRMKGEWVLVHMKGRDRSGKQQWLLIKHRDEFATPGANHLTDDFTTSVETGRDLEGIAKGEKSKRKASTVEPGAQWESNRAPAKPAKPARSRAKRSAGRGAEPPTFRPPELATLVDRVPDGNGWLFEMKYDGYRCLAAVSGSEVRLYTRNGNDWTEQFRSLVPAFEELTEGSALIDGEVCAFKDGRSDFSTLKTALSKGDPLTYFAFDLLEENGEDLTGLPLTERKARLKALLGERDRQSPIQFSDHVVGHGEEVFEAMCKGGFEGVIAKRATSVYVGDRTTDWLKIKCLHRQEFVIGGWRPSDKRARFASLLLGTWEGGKLIYHGRVGTGFDEASATRLQQELDSRARDTSPFASVPRDIQRRAKWVEPELVAEVAFTEFTPDGVLRHPSFLGLRADKPAASVVLEKPMDTQQAESEPAKVTEAPPADDPAPATAARGRRKPAARAPAEAGAKGKKAAAAQTISLTEAEGIEAAKKAGVRLTSPDRVEYPGESVTKGVLAAYYARVVEQMLPHIGDRPLSLVRCPQGRAKQCFFQKHDSGGFPTQMKKLPIAEKDGHIEDYFYIDDLAGLLAGVQMNVLEFHIWGSRRADVERPDRIIFDIDPDPGLGFDEVTRAAADIRGVLEALGLQSFPLLSGGKGVHVVAPLLPELEWNDVKAFCHGVALKLSEAEPDRFLANMSKAKRVGRMFIDYLRNERGSTAICPWSTRARDGAPCAVPVSWDELPGLPAANVFGVEKAAARALQPDPWTGYFKLKQKITPAMLRAVGG